MDKKPVKTSRNTIKTSIKSSNKTKLSEKSQNMESKEKIKENNILVGDLNYIKFSENAELPNKSDLLEYFDLNEKPIYVINSGAYNFVYIHSSKNSNKNYAYRISKSYYFRINTNAKSTHVHNQLLLDKGLLDHDDNIYNGILKLKKEMDATKDNWITASEYGLSPEIYYYGFHKERTDIPGEYDLYHIIISDVYDIDIFKYYNIKQVKEWRTQGRESENDIIINEKLIELLMNMSKNMSMICYDIKPNNCVIKFKKDSRLIEDVRLIDWDGDWCINYKALTRGNIDDQIYFVPFLISVMFMANHFLKYFNWNIFYNFFDTESTIPGLTYETHYYKSMKEVFCSETSPYSEKYETIVKHYFKDKNFIKSNQKDKIFDEMFSNAKIQKKNEEPIH